MINNKEQLKEKTLKGFFWSFSDRTLTQIFQFIIGIILARLLLPYEFGLIGMLTIFIAVSQVFIESGFSEALIQKKETTPEDYNTAFYFNFVVACIIYTIIFFSAGLIASFFNEPQLDLLLKVLALLLIINALAIIQRTILIKSLNFRAQAKINIISVLLSGTTAIFMAYKGYGVWSLVVRTLVMQLSQTVLLFIRNRWIPNFRFSKNSFKQLFSFGSNLLVAGLIDTVYRNVYYLIIGKYFSATDLGFYTQADKFKNLVSQNFTSTIQKVSYPALSKLQDDQDLLKKGYQKIIKLTMFIIFPMMIVFAIISEPLIIFTIGEKWRPSVIYLQLLCFVGMLYPLHVLNLTMLKVKGRTDLLLKLEILKKSMIIPVIIIGIQWGITGLIYGLIVQSSLALFVNSYYSGILIGYSTRDQIKDILPMFLTALILAIPVYLSGFVLPEIDYIKIIVQLILAVALFLIISRFWNYSEYKTFLDIAVNLIKHKKVAV